MAKRGRYEFKCLQVVAKGQRKPRRRGELFRLQTKQLGPMFGVVACDNVTLRAMDGKKWSASVPMLLLYIYKHTVADRRELLVRNFAIKPKVVFGNGWTQGLFETIDHIDDSQYERLSVHCFGPVALDRDPRETYYDESGEWLDGPSHLVLRPGVCWVEVLDQLIFVNYVEPMMLGEKPILK